MPEPSFNCFNSLIHQLFHWFVFGASDRTEETRPGLCPPEAHEPVVPGDKPVAQQAGPHWGHMYTSSQLSGLTVVKGTGLGVRWIRFPLGSVSYWFCDNWCNLLAVSYLLLELSSGFSQMSWCCQEECPPDYLVFGSNQPLYYQLQCWKPPQHTVQHCHWEL